MIEKRAQYDPARLLTISALTFVCILILFVALIIGWQIWKSGEANTESWAALTGLIGWTTGQVSMIFSARYGTTQQSVMKDATIQAQATTAAIAAGAAVPVKNGAIKTEQVNVEAKNVEVNQPTGEVKS